MPQRVCQFPEVAKDSAPGVFREPKFFSTQISKARRFYLGPVRGRNPLVIVCGGCEYCAPDYRIHRSDFPYYSIEFVAGGKGWLTLRNRRCPLTPGAVFAYGPGMPHDIRSFPDRPLVKYFVDFLGRRGRQLLKASGLERGRIVPYSLPNQIQQLFEDLISTGLRQSRFSRAICAAIVEQMLLRIAESTVSPKTAATPAFATYQRCRAYLETHYGEMRKLSEVAAQCHIDPAYLCRLFSRYDHQSPYRYLIRLKMCDAAQRLQMPGALVKQVAGAIGFDDPFQFSRTFRRIYGISPRKFVQLRRRRI